MQTPPNAQAGDEAMQNEKDNEEVVAASKEINKAASSSSSSDSDEPAKLPRPRVLLPSPP